MIYAEKRIFIQRSSGPVNPKNGPDRFGGGVGYSVGCIFMKVRRHSAIRQLIERDPVRSQDELRRKLAARGFVVTQGTLSRDIKQIGLVKRSADGAYQPLALDAPPPPAAAMATLGRALAEFLQAVDVSEQLLVVRTGPGQAQLLGIAIDRAQLDGVLGTVAGDDTILVICRTPRAARTTAARLGAMADLRGQEQRG